MLRFILPLFILGNVEAKPPTGVNPDTHVLLLVRYKKQPLPLNKQSLRLLQARGLLSENQVKSFCEFVDKYGELDSIKDLNILV